jgi:hypothetical protein
MQKLIGRALADTTAFVGGLVLTENPIAAFEAAQTADKLVQQVPDSWWGEPDNETALVQPPHIARAVSVPNPYHAGNNQVVGLAGREYKAAARMPTLVWNSSTQLPPQQLPVIGIDIVTSPQIASDLTNRTRHPGNIAATLRKNRKMLGDVY